MKEIQVGAVFSEFGVLKSAMEIKYVMFIIIIIIMNTPFLLDQQTDEPYKNVCLRNT